MSIIDFVKDKIAEKVIEKELKPNQEKQFSTFFKKSFSFVVILPEEDNDFNHCFEVLRFLDNQRKTFTLFMPEFKVSLLPQIYRQKAISYTLEDISKLKLPSKKLTEKMHAINAQAVIDLNRVDNVFYSVIANMVDSPIRIGFKKTNSDKFYNVQIENNSENPEISYKNFLNCLQMF